jgi:hypothetical protein
MLEADGLEPPTGMCLTFETLMLDLEHYISTCLCHDILWAPLAKFEIGTQLSQLSSQLSSAQAT